MPGAELRPKGKPLQIAYRDSADCSQPQRPPGGPELLVIIRQQSSRIPFAEDVLCAHLQPQLVAEPSGVCIDSSCLSAAGLAERTSISQEQVLV